MLTGTVDEQVGDHLSRSTSSSHQYANAPLLARLYLFANLKSKTDLFRFNRTRSIRLTAYKGEPLLNEGRSDQRVHNRTRYVFH